MEELGGEFHIEEGELAGNRVGRAIELIEQEWGREGSDIRVVYPTLGDAIDDFSLRPNDIIEKYGTREDKKAFL